MAERVRHIRAIERVKVKFADAGFGQLVALFGRDGNGDEFASFGIVIETVEERRHGAGNRGAGLGGERGHGFEIRYRHEAGNDWHRDAGFAGAVDEAEVSPIVEKELRDRARGAGVDFAFEVVEFGVERARVRVSFGEGGNADFEIVPGAEAGDEIRCLGVTVGVRGVAGDAGWWIAAEGDDVAHAHVPVLIGDFIDVIAGRIDASEMRRWDERAFVENSLYGAMGAFAGTATGAVGDGDELWAQWFESLDGVPKVRFHLRRFWREELERDFEREWKRERSHVSRWCRSAVERFSFALLNERPEAWRRVGRAL